MHRLFPNYVIRMWMKDAGDGVTAMLYGPSAIRTTVGSDKREVEIVQTTDYPFGEQIDFTIDVAHPVSFPLSLRIPAWCDAPRILINASRFLCHLSRKDSSLLNEFSILPIRLP